ncbi:MAG: fluoride efflux transporter CrcB [Anaerolineae bacterium]|nr:fluoride efflux transporter CrcB [Anaerolineae bacterium]
MGQALWVGLGGFIGAVLRYVVGGAVQRWSKAVAFPYGTLAVNLIGCLAIGFFSQVADRRGFFSAEGRAFAFLGVLGAFTTFSTFGSDSVELFRAGQSVPGLLNVGGHIVLGLGAVLLGRYLGQWV